MVEDALGTDLVVYDGHWLQSVGQDDVGVHGRDIHVVDQGTDVQALQVREVSQIDKLLAYLFSNLES